jgi:putative endonuclease
MDPRLRGDDKAASEDDRAVCEDAGRTSEDDMSTSSFSVRTYKMPNKEYYTYILASQKYGTLYIGVTNNLIKRIYQHKEEQVKGFTKKYGLRKLVYYETHCDINEAILREKQLKKWRRDWKISLIEENNPHWIDIYNELI